MIFFCNVCYVHQTHLVKCSNCNFFICDKCDRRLTKCPQCRIDNEGMLFFTIISNMKKYDEVNDEENDDSKTNNNNCCCYEEDNDDEDNDSDINHNDRYCFDGENSDEDPIESLQNKLAMEIFGF